jgi:GntR family transcriptional regulator/MocR family aminotransferase
VAALKRPTPVSLAALSIDPHSPVPLYQQLYAALRATILAQPITGNVRLPSTRALAAARHVSRTTVLNAFSQLVAEGYLEGRHGAGTYITGHLPAADVPARVVLPFHPTIPTLS